MNRETEHPISTQDSPFPPGLPRKKFISVVDIYFVRYLETCPPRSHHFDLIGSGVASLSRQSRQPRRISCAYSTTVFLHKNFVWKFLARPKERTRRASFTSSSPHMALPGATKRIDARAASARSPIAIFRKLQVSTEGPSWPPVVMQSRKISRTQKTPFFFFFFVLWVRLILLSSHSRRNGLRGSRMEMGMGTFYTEYGKGRETNSVRTGVAQAFLPRTWIPGALARAGGKYIILFISHLDLAGPYPHIT